MEVRKPTDEEKERAKEWPVWEKEISGFDWSYDEPETCLILSGKATVTGGGKTISFTEGDWVVFPKGLSCTWKITEPIKKRYHFG